MVTKKKAIFLDRDGVINKSLVVDGKPFAPRFFNDFELIKGVEDALKSFHRLDYLNIVVTNQPDIANHLMAPDELNRMNKFLLSKLPIAKIYVCTHASSAKCDCRKPKPGMIFRAAERFNIDLSQSVLVGDRWKDVACGHAAGVSKVFFVDYKYDEPKPIGTYVTIKSLVEVVKLLQTAEI